VGNFAIGGLLGLIAGFAAIASGRVGRDHRGFAPPRADAPLDVPLWIVVTLCVGMGVLGPLASVWRSLSAE
jgi:hypothetical protein